MGKGGKMKTDGRSLTSHIHLERMEIKEEAGGEEGWMIKGMKMKERKAGKFNEGRLTRGEEGQMDGR